MGERARQRTIALVGARGHVGREFLQLVATHPALSLTLACSRAYEGRRVDEVVSADDAKVDPGWAGGLCFEALSPHEIAGRKLDVYVLGLPSDLSASYVEAIDKIAPDAVVIDLSGDHRFDDSWTYCVPEHHRERARGARRIANPGCYATAMQLALWPLVDRLDGAATCVGVSGYSGAGTTPSAKNDLDRLRDNLLAYSLINHLHEREVCRALRRDVHFSPLVASFFRGIHMTTHVSLAEPCSVEALAEIYQQRYGHERLVRIDGDATVRDCVGRHEALVAAIAVSGDGRRAVVCTMIDNLLKGAATQAMQNVNLACGYDEFSGITPWLEQTSKGGRA